MGAHCRDQWGVILHHRREANSELGLAEACAAEDNIWALAPGHKVQVVLHTGNHSVHLLHGVPGAKRTTVKNILWQACDYDKATTDKQAGINLPPRVQKGHSGMLCIWRSETIAFGVVFDTETHE